MEWVGKVREIYLRSLQIGRRTDRVLQRAALAGVVRLIENTVGGADQQFAAAGGVQGKANAGSKGGFLVWN